MRKIFTIAIIALSINAFGQMILEHSYIASQSDLSIINLSNGGHKYAIFDGNSIKIYSLLHNLEKTIVLPQLNVTNWTYQANVRQVKFISDKLFNYDTTVEYLAEYHSWDPNCGLDGKDTSFIVLMDENTNILQSNIASQYSCGSGGYARFPVGFDFYTVGTISKILIKYYNGTDHLTSVFSVAGIIPCEECTVSSGIYENFNSNFTAEISAYPNPANNECSFVFKLPNNVNSGNIKIHNNLGQLIQTISIQNNISEKTINISNLSMGQYYYTLDGNSFKTLAKKLIILR